MELRQLQAGFVLLMSMRNDLEDLPALCLVTGLSGAGKSTALRAFEDINYFSVDGLPAMLLPDMAKLLQRPEMRHYRGIAIGMDMREPDFLQAFNSALLDLSARNVCLNLLFLDASEKELFRRYAATRRPHPLERQGIGLAGAIRLEREQLQTVQGMADLVMDTTDFNIYDLRRAIRKYYLERVDHGASLRVNLVSFGFKYGIPDDANYVFDLRFLPNPYFVEQLKPFSGKDVEVSDYIFGFPQAREFLGKLVELFNFLLPLIASEGRSRVTVALGCTGGRHRSVALAEKLANILSDEGYELILEHRNINSDTSLHA